jgi:hypothetical protein
MSVKFAFRCVNCGHLAEPGEAGERSVPAACRVCGKGVHFDPVTGFKEYDEDNWQVLVELPAAEKAKLLKFHALEESDIAKHKPYGASASRAPMSLERAVEDGLPVESGQ